MARAGRLEYAMTHVALETTLLLHGVPNEAAIELDRSLRAIVLEAGAEPALVGVLDGAPRADLHPEELAGMLSLESVPKLNNSNLGIAIARSETGATTVGATMEIAASNGIRFFATGGLGGVHPNLGDRLDVSGDLGAFTRFPVAVVTSGTKSILDVPSTRELLETLGVPVVGYRTDHFPAFYRRATEPTVSVDARFDDIPELARFCRMELERTGRGVVVCNPIGEPDELPAALWEDWLARAEGTVSRASGRDVTPAVLSALHRISEGRTLAANLALVRSNVALAARLAAVPLAP